MLQLFMTFGAWLLFLCAAFSLAGCFDDEPPALPGSTVEVSLYTGIPGVASLGDNFNKVTSRLKVPYQRSDIAPNSELGKLGFSEMVQIRAFGTRLYFKRDGVGLITAQEPFKGKVKGKKINLFSFAVPAVSNWESHLVRELGQPESRASGGRFGSEALFYNWGDISFNRMGPNEIALYRNADLSNYRLTHFGRELQFFPKQ